MTPKPFIFSADSHIMEPSTLFLDMLPASLKQHAVRAAKEGEYIVTKTDHKILHRIRVGLNDERALVPDRKGIREIPGRLDDMELEGIDAEICFPSIGLFLFSTGHAEAEAASCRIYNDWNNGFLGGHKDRFVRCGTLPVLDLSNTLAELHYLHALGFSAAMLPSATPTGGIKYNDARWDPIFNLAGELGIVIVMHTGTGLETSIPERGPGGAIINYGLQLGDAIHTAMYLIAGGVLDRNPKSRVAFIECGASWLVGLAERLDEVNIAHQGFVRPKLSRVPSQIMNDQIYASFQNERNCITTVDRPGGRNIMWGSDYPHAEGTWPNSRRIQNELFEGLDVSAALKADVLGLNAARLFGVEPVIHTSQAAPGIVTT